MRQSTWIPVLLAALVCSLLITNCSDDVRYHTTCTAPAVVQEDQIGGAWQAEYRSFLAHDPDQGATRVSGIERLVVFGDGTYIQTFEAPTYRYASERNPWRLVNEGDGPKMELQGWRYFANGIEASQQSLKLHVQTPDGIRFRAEHGYGPDTRSVRLGVQYPQDGFVYLYPRNCLGKFVLLQMVSNPADPDDPTVHNPPFEKLRSE